MTLDRWQELVASHGLGVQETKSIIEYAKELYENKVHHLYKYKYNKYPSSISWLTLELGLGYRRGLVRLGFHHIVNLRTCLSNTNLC